MISYKFNDVTGFTRPQKRFAEKFERAMDWVTSTDVGQSLWVSFLESGGRIKLAPEMDGARGRYNFKKNWVLLGKDFTPSDIVHELGHARQYRKVLDFMNRPMNLVDEQHRSILIEADSWAIASIFLKQFFRKNMGNVEVLDEFMAAEKKMFIHSRIVAPNKLPGERRLWSTLELDLTAARNYAAGEGKKIYADDITEDLIAEINDSDFDGYWASEIFRRSFIGMPESLSKQTSNAANYANRVFLSSISTKEGFDRFIEGIKIEGLDAEDYRHVVRTLGDLTDLGIPASYIDEEQNLDWCLKTPKPVIENFRKLAVAMESEHVRRTAKQGMSP